MIIVALATTTSTYAQKSKKSIAIINYENYKKEYEKQLDARSPFTGKFKSKKQHSLQDTILVEKNSFIQPCQETSRSSNEREKNLSNQKQHSIWFSDKTSMREAKITEVMVDEKTLFIKIKFNEGKIISICITKRSVKNEDPSGFTLINSCGEYDEEIYIIFEDNNTRAWFRTVLETFSGKILDIRAE